MDVSDARDGLSTVTIGELRHCREALTDETMGEGPVDTEPDTEPGSLGSGGLVGSLSQAITAKLAGQEYEPVIVGDYELERLVGIGGMGQVFAARSLTSDHRVALKILHRSSVGALMGLKREFRVLAEVAHPNLVNLDALVVAPDAHAFFTMELVNGVPFVEYVRGHLRRGTPPNEVRLRRALVQLVSALEHLHARGYVHRDLKPSNVLVTEHGRVVVLDFGLVHELEPTSELGDAHLLGTPAYMAPEQAALAAAGPPADLYALGGMLFESLCGARPFVGTTRDVLRAKLDGPAPDPATLVSDCDVELLALCRDLLAREPSLRPSASAVLERLRQTPQVASAPSSPFIGRRPELAALDAALLELHTQARALVTLISGPSGQGKSMLLSRWQAGLDGDELVLRGRCLERESVPYKGLDAVIDALSRHLRRLPAAALEALRPAHVAEIVRLFPVLGEVWFEPAAAALGLEPAEHRERAVSGLRELLARLARARTVVIVLDDFQWADTDSSALLEQLLDSAVGPRSSLVVAYREPPDPGPAMTRLHELRSSPYVELRTLALGPLTPDESRELVLPTLAHAQGKPVEHPEVLAAAELIVSEGAGNPLHLRELARGHGRELHEGDDGHDLDRLIVQRILELTPSRRRVLIFVALAEGPIERAALSVAGCDAADVDALVAQELLRLSEFDDEQVEVGQDRIARLAIAELERDELPGHHLRLAAALASVDASPELLAKHYERGGQHELAFLHARRAADQAMDALAFRRAAMWLERCLAWLPPGDEAPRMRRELEQDLVTTYVNSGRLVEGAELLLAQAGAPGVDDARGLRIRAVEYLLAAGHMREGARAAAELLAAVGLTLPRRRARMLLNVLNFRRGLRRDLARLDAAPDPELRRDPMLRERARIVEALANGFMSHDGLLALHFNILRRRFSIDVGDLASCGRALGVDAAFCSTAGWAELIPGLLERAQVLGGSDNRVRVWLAAMKVHVGLNLGDFGRTLEALEAVLPELEAHADAHWERRMANVGALGVRLFAGHHRAAIVAGRRGLELGVELGDIKHARDYSGMLAAALVCVGELDEATQVISEIERLERGVVDTRYLFADLFRDFAKIRRLLRIQAADQALVLARRLPADLQRDGLWHVKSFRFEALATIACAELQVWLRAGSQRERRQGRKRLRRLARQLAKGSAYQRGNAAMIEATLRQLDGDHQAAQAGLADAQACFSSCGAEAHLAAVRVRRAMVCPDEQARGLRAQAEAYFRREAIREPKGLIMILAPGPLK